MAPQFKRGDDLVVKLKTSYNTVESVTVHVIGISADVDIDLQQYLCYVPNWILIESSFEIKKEHTLWFNTKPKFIGGQAVILKSPFSIIRHIKSLDGALCNCCNMFIEYVENNDFFICRSCKENPFR